MNMEEIGYLEEVGAVEDYGIGRRRRRPSGNGVPGRRALAAPAQGNPRVFVSAIPGVPTPGRRVKPLGLPPVTFALGGQTRQVSSVVLQKPIAPLRLFIAERRIGASGGQVTIDSFKIGSDEQLISGGVPIEMFAAAVFELGMQLDEGAAGLTIAIAYIISSLPTGTDTVTISAGLNCQTMG